MGPLFFDLDMTLIETRRDLSASANEVRRQLGLSPLSVDLIATYIGDGVGDLLERAIGDEVEFDAEDALRRFRAHYWDHCLDATHAYTGIPELLARLSGRPLAVVSNKPERFCRHILDGLRLAAHFDTMVGGDSAPARKPDPAPLRLAAERLGLSAEDAVMIGDTWRDVRSGKAAGCRTIAVTYGLDSEEKLKAEAPDALCPDVASVARCLDEWP